MIEKMSFINITGPIKKLDEFVVAMILPYDVELVNAATIVDKVRGINRFSDVNPYKKPIDIIRKISDLTGMNLSIKSDKVKETFELEDMTKELELFYDDIKDKKDRLSKLSKEIEIKEQLKSQIIPIKNIQVDIQEFFDFDYLKFRFGSMPIDQFEKIKVFEEEMELIVYETSRTKKLVYLMYFMPRSKRIDIDKLFASMHFDRIRISDDIAGHPADAYNQLSEEIKALEEEQKMIEEYISELIKKNEEELCIKYNYLTRLNHVFSVRDLAIKTEEAFYLTGWIQSKFLPDFQRDIDKIESVALILDDNQDMMGSQAPTKLNNPKLFRPFEALVNMYGVPSYGELDPTIFVAICYVLLFGIMFGDVGQGLVIATLSFIFYKKYKQEVILIGVYIGISAMVFGFVYGSIFGDEHVLGHMLAYKPVNALESTMEVLMVTTGLGILLILIAMAFNFRNLIKRKNFGKLLTDKNGIAGLLFYLVLLGIIYLLYRNVSINIPVVIGMLVAPLIVMFFGTPISKLIDKKRYMVKEEESKVEVAFELFETVLSFLSNTISFIRVGAFALNHVGFFLAFKMLSDMVSKSFTGVAGVVVMIIGNILIIVLEGLIVGIQAMRLTYYELFSRFYSGSGKKFKPYKIEDEH